MLLTFLSSADSTVSLITVPLQFVLIALVLVSQVQRFKTGLACNGRPFVQELPSQTTKTRHAEIFSVQLF